ncbi:hypothetical protein CNR22_18980 [Sphingobacteriaceae bacterium]|nr:hypothetical protein CNR22_18980 [Sphingobacteriaceae bacterium]
MRIQSQVNLSGYITELLRAGKKKSDKDLLALGKTFTYNSEIAKLKSLFASLRPWPKNAIPLEFDVTDPVAAFYIFVLFFHKYFNSYSKKRVRESENKISKLAELLAISDEDKQQLTSFFLNEEPYTDKIKAVYFTAQKRGGLNVHVGAHIMHAANRNNEIVYLKYFEKYGVFLSKVFIKENNPYHFIEAVSVKEIDIVTSGNYLMNDFGYHTFDEIVEAVLSHRPFQYYELAATSNTPKIVLDPENGKVIISGSSSPFSPTNFFTPILEWLDGYASMGKKPLQIFIMLDYFNTYTSKFLVRLCRQCDTMAKDAKEVNIYWYFDPEDTDMREFGEHLAGIYKKGFSNCLISDGIEELV